MPQNKLSSLKQYILIISLFLQVRSLGCLSRVPCNDATKVSRMAQSSGAMTVNKSASKLLQVVSRISFFAAVTLRFLASRWFLAGGHSQLLQAAHISLPRGPLHGFLTTWQMASSKTARGKEPNVICNHWVTAHHLCPVLLVRNKSQTHHSRRGALQGLDH